ncbi:MAG TPA: hypothetical protein VJH03_24305 [Blastocatellia bacterium]|nr:hypothetical protein [Blastocatellia bacterium]
MAVIVRGKSACSVCGKVIEERDQIVATSQFIQDKADPLWPFSNTAIHKRCFLGWKLRSEFVDRYNEIAPSTFAEGTFHRMKSDGSFSIGAGNAEGDVSTTGEVDGGSGT